MTKFRAMWVEEVSRREFRRQIVERDTADLPPHDTLIEVHFSSLNYKDALCARGHRGITRHYPHTPGIDAAGTIVESANPALQPGAQVIVTGFDLGMNTPGGFGQCIRVPADWVVPLPESLSLFEAMAYGTAGLTAGLAIDALQHNNVTPNRGDVLVTGATGGVGSFAVAMLAKLGYRVVAASNKPGAKAWLRALGVHEVVSREAIDDDSGLALLPACFAGAIDTLGGNVLATVIKSIQFGGAVAAIGLALSPELPTTVHPFILRGVNLLGIASADTPIETKRRIWEKLAGDWRPDALHHLARICTLDALTDEIDRMLAGELTGRVVVDLQST